MTKLKLVEQLDDYGIRIRKPDTFSCKVLNDMLRKEREINGKPAEVIENT